MRLILLRVEDLLSERYRLVRALARWRIVTFCVVALAGLVLAIALDSKPLGGHVARIRLDGVILSDPDFLALLESVREDSSVKAVVLAIDSPGGSTVGAENLYEGIRKLSESKPTVAVVDTLAASGGYIAAIASERIWARQTSLVGSIGVLVQFPNVSKLLDSVGVKMEEVKTSPLKAAPNGFEPTSEEARDALRAVVMDSYAWFKDLVRARRGLQDDDLARVADGRVFTGRQALELKLIDALGGEPEAREWLQTSKSVSKDMPVVEWEVASADSGVFSRVLHRAARALGWDRFLTSRGVTGGLVSQWSPQLQ